MFNRRIVFVLGAGASAELGLPTGADLKELVGAGVKFRFERYSQEPVNGDPALLALLQRRFRADKERVNVFTRAGNELADTIRTFPSIDEALHWWRARPEIVELGKLAIAYYILKAESECLLAPNQDRGKVESDNARDTWLAPFLSMSLSALDRNDSYMAFDKVTLINFNYDRTVEQYLYWALQQTAGISPDDARTAIGHLTVIRPYGSLGELPWQNEASGISFGGSAGTRDDMFAVSTSIRTFTEKAIEAHTVDAIGNALDSAAIVIFLGFGFHQQNLALFKPKQGHSRPVVERAMATVLGIAEHDRTAIQETFQDSLGFARTILAPVPSANLLRDLRLSIMSSTA